MNERGQGARRVSVYVVSSRHQRPPGSGARSYIMPWIYSCRLQQG